MIIYKGQYLFGEFITAEDISCSFASEKLKRVGGWKFVFAAELCLTGTVLRRGGYGGD